MTTFISLDNQLTLKERRCVLSFVDDTFDIFMGATSSNDLSSEEVGTCLEDFWRKVKAEYTQASCDRKSILKEIFCKVLAMPIVDPKQARRLQEGFDKLDPSIRETGKK